MLISYNWLKSYIPDIPNVDEVTELLTFKLCEIEDVEKLPNLPDDKAGGDSVFDLKILPDRAHDLLSHCGVAREIAGLLGIDFKLPEYKIPESKPSSLSIEIESPNCRRYMGRIVRNIKVGPSPEWMVQHLQAIGQRSINNIVDATNIVMFDCGQPIHAFDLRAVSDSLIVVKEAKEGDSIELVGSEKITAKLKDTDMMITDGKNNLAIAGVKGGISSGVSNESVDILIEVANFNPVKVRKTSRRLGIKTEASKRYENDLSPTLCSLAMDEITALIFEMCPEAVFEETVDIYPVLENQRKVSFTQKYISKILGVEIKDEDIEKILKNYKYQFSHRLDLWEVEIPSMRLDLTGPHDFAEEIGRVYGYDKIIQLLPEVSKDILPDNKTWIKICLAKQKLVEGGYKEVMTYVFRNKGEFEVLASASDKNYLRTNLVDGLKESIILNQKNLPLLGFDEVKIFEVGTIFKNNKEEIHVAYGNKKNIEEESLDKYIEDNYPEISPDILSCISLSPYYKELTAFEMWSVYPFITRDIAVWIPEGVRPEILIDIYKDFGTELLACEPKLFDSFTKDKRTSFAYRLVFQSKERTLTDEEINKIMSEITEKIVSLGWEVR